MERSAIFFIVLSYRYCLPIYRNRYRMTELFSVQKIHFIIERYVVSKLFGTIPNTVPPFRRPFIIIFFFLLHPVYDPRTTRALPSSSNSDPGSHIPGPPSPSPPRGACLQFLSREELSIFFPRGTPVEFLGPVIQRKSKQHTYFQIYSCTSCVILTPPLPVAPVVWWSPSNTTSVRPRVRFPPS